jgi:hypothetical protein
MTLGGVSKMSGLSAETIMSKIAELSFAAVIAGIPTLEIPIYVRDKLLTEHSVSSTELANALTLQFSNDEINLKLPT